MSYVDNMEYIKDKRALSQIVKDAFGKPENLHITQVAFAKKLGIKKSPQTYVSSICNGWVNLAPKHALATADALKLNREHFLFRVLKDRTPEIYNSLLEVLPRHHLTEQEEKLIALARELGHSNLLDIDIDKLGQIIAVIKNQEN